MSSKWPFNLDPTEPQFIASTDGTMVGTCYYIAPEAILEAGWTIEELKRASTLSGDEYEDLTSSLEDMELNWP